MEHSLLAGESRSKKPLFVKSSSKQFRFRLFRLSQCLFLGHICGLFLNSGTF